MGFNIERHLQKHQSIGQMTVRNISNKSLFILILMQFLASISRGFFAYDLPLSGDEVGVGVLQATGHAHSYKYSLPVGIVPISKLKEFIDYSEDKNVKDIFHSLRYEGMHPPFYYILMHYTIQLFNNSVITLRMLSLLFSVVAILFIFLLGMAIHGEFLGWLSALFLTLSAYSLQYSVMVRPYPLLMFLSIFSSFLVYLLVKNSKFHFKEFGCYLYILISVVGLYSQYLYIYIIFFQAIFVFLSSEKTFNRILLISLIYSFIGLLYIPWLPYLIDQLDGVNKSNLYFNGQYNPLLIIYIVIRNNFLLYPFQASPSSPILSPINILLLSIVLFIFFLGCMKFVYSKQTRKFFSALLIYFVIHFIGDRLMESKILVFEKFQFFLIPMFFFILAFGIVNITNRFFIRTGVILFILTLLTFSSVTVFQAKMNFDGPTIVKFLNFAISNKRVSENDQALLIVNASARRTLFSVVHSIDQPIDILILTGQETSKTLSKIDSVAQYDTIFLANLVVPDQLKSRLADQDIQLIEEYLERERFSIENLLLNNSEGTLTQFTQ